MSDYCCFKVSLEGQRLLGIKHDGSYGSSLFIVLPNIQLGRYYSAPFYTTLSDISLAASANYTILAMFNAHSKASVAQIAFYVPALILAAVLRRRHGRPRMPWVILALFCISESYFLKPIRLD